jgi:hypothetical protein
MYSSLALCNTSCFTRSVQLYLLRPSPTPHFKTFMVFLTSFSECPICSTVNSCAPNAALRQFLPEIQVRFAGDKESSRCIRSFGWFPGVWDFCAEVSQHCFLFIGRLNKKNDCDEIGGVFIQNTVKVWNEEGFFRYSNPCCLRYSWTWR